MTSEDESILKEKKDRINNCQKENNAFCSREFPCADCREDLGYIEGFLAGKEVERKSKEEEIEDWRNQVKSCDAFWTDKYKVALDNWKHWYDEYKKLEQQLKDKEEKILNILEELRITNCCKKRKDCHSYSSKGNCESCKTYFKIEEALKNKIEGEDRG